MLFLMAVVAGLALELLKRKGFRGRPGASGR